jgi:type II secretory pathway pseudopilin PulG
MRRPRTATGFTLVEYMVAIGVAGLVMMALATLSLYSGRSFAGLANYADLNTSSLHAIDRLTRDVRQTVRLTGFTTNQLVFDDGTNRPPLVITYSPQERTLTRQQGTESEILLKGCDYLKFSIYQRTPLPGTYDQFPTADANTCKVVEMTWTCSRTILGARVNTENAQTAKIVIRNR